MCILTHQQCVIDTLVYARAENSFLYTSQSPTGVTAVQEGPNSIVLSWSPSMPLATLSPTLEAAVVR